MGDETVDSRSGAKPRKQKLIRHYRRQTGQRHAQCVMVEHRHAKQRRGEKQEINRNPERYRWLAQGVGRCAPGSSISARLGIALHLPNRRDDFSTGGNSSRPIACPRANDGGF